MCMGVRAKDNNMHYKSCMRVRIRRDHRIIQARKNEHTNINSLSLSRQSYRRQGGAVGAVRRMHLGGGVVDRGEPMILEVQEAC